MISLIKACAGLYIALIIYHIVFFNRELPEKVTLNYTELPLLLSVFITGYLFLKDSRYRGLFAALPIFLTYLAHDYYLWIFKRCPNLRELTKIEELLGILTPLSIALTVAATLGLSAILIFALNKKRLLSWRILILVLWSIPTTLIWNQPGEVYAKARHEFQLKQWSALKNVQNHGRLFMTFVRAADHLNNLRKLQANLGDIENSALYIQPEAFPTFQPRNVHIVVMESFIDATLLENVKFSRPPIHEDMQAILDAGRSTSISPYFGGGTAESEFEVLCGVHAFTWYQEFKLMTGAPTYCLPRILGLMGYDTIARHPFKQVMYNRDLAYQSLGFQQKYFLDTTDPAMRLFEKPRTSEHVLDINLYARTLESLKSQLHTGRPVFNYLLTMEGHTPFHLDSATQPVVVEVEPENWLTQVLANKTYYRTKALAGYINKLMTLDPESIIIAVADHLPPMTEHGADFYESWGYSAWNQGKSKLGLREQFLVVIDAGEVMTLAPLNHYNIYQFVLNSLSRGGYCKDHSCWNSPSDVPQASLSEENYKNLLGMSMIPETTANLH
ncbi:MAG: sulfatase-like hydrolase/transferase [Deltaproteobacteria bacterium]|nr:sulfatase-like hydrolase/transferase [Deltaproteobacteria bacterium]